MPNFNFDILIIIIILYAILKGYNRGIFHQLTGTLSLVIPYIIILFWGDKILIAAKAIPFINSTILFFYNILKNFFGTTYEYLETLFIYSLVFVIIYFIMRSVFKVVSPTKKANLLNEITNTSKVIGSAIGVVSAYLICIIVFILIKPMTNIDVDKPITNIVIKSSSILTDDFKVLEIIIPEE